MASRSSSVVWPKKQLSQPLPKGKPLFDPCLLSALKMSMTSRLHFQPQQCRRRLDTHSLSPAHRSCAHHLPCLLWLNLVRLLSLLRLARRRRQPPVYPARSPSTLECPEQRTRFGLVPQAECTAPFLSTSTSILFGVSTLGTAHRRLLSLPYPTSNRPPLVGHSSSPSGLLSDAILSMISIHQMQG